MKIECILRRDPPTVVTLGTTAYQFQPDEQGRHVCEVEDPAHLARLLSISEAYRLPGDVPIPQELIPAIVEQSLPAAAAVLTPIDEHAIKGSTVHPPQFDLGGPEPVSLDDAVAHALDLSGLTTAEWNALPDEERHTLIDIGLDDLDQREHAEGEQPATYQAAKPTTETAPVSDDGSSNGAAPNNGQDATDAEIEGLRAQYLERFGKKPHHKAGIAKLRDELSAGSEGA